MDKDDNPLKNAPHTQAELMADTWNHKYTREQVSISRRHLQMIGHSDYF
jgi:hypothetical protein